MNEENKTTDFEKMDPENAKQAAGGSHGYPGGCPDFYGKKSPVSDCPHPDEYGNHPECIPCRRLKPAKR